MINVVLPYQSLGYSLIRKYAVGEVFSFINQHYVGPPVGGNNLRYKKCPRTQWVVCTDSSNQTMEWLDDLEDAGRARVVTAATPIPAATLQKNPRDKRELHCKTVPGSHIERVEGEFYYNPDRGCWRVRHTFTISGSVNFWRDAYPEEAAAYDAGWEFNGSPWLPANGIPMKTGAVETDAERRKRLACGCECGAWVTGGIHSDWCKHQGQHCVAVYF